MPSIFDICWNQLCKIINKLLKPFKQDFVIHTFQLQETSNTCTITVYS